VWHHPHLTAAGRRKQRAGEATVSDGAAVEAAIAGHRLGRGKNGSPDSRRDAVRVVAKLRTTIDPKEAERDRLLGRLLAVEGRPAISKAAQDYLAAGFEFPRTQHVWLQLLEHSDERTVEQAIVELDQIFDREAPARWPVLDSRLRRLEEYADEGTVRGAASELRRKVHSRWASTAC
jgi:hypothetical protein